MAVEISQELTRRRQLQALKETLGNTFLDLPPSPSLAQCHSLLQHFPKSSSEVNVCLRKANPLPAERALIIPILLINHVQSDVSVWNAWEVEIPEDIREHYAVAVGILAPYFGHVDPQKSLPEPPLAPLKVPRRRSPAYTRRMIRRRTLRELTRKVQDLAHEVSRLPEYHCDHALLARLRCTNELERLSKVCAAALRDVKKIRLRDTRQKPRPVPSTTSLRERPEQVAPDTDWEAYAAREIERTSVSQSSYVPTNPMRSSMAVHSAMLRFGEPRGDDGDDDDDDNFYDAEW